MARGNPEALKKWREGKKQRFDDGISPNWHCSHCDHQFSRNMADNNWMEPPACPVCEGSYMVRWIGA